MVVFIDNSKWMRIEGDEKVLENTFVKVLNHKF